MTVEYLRLFSAMSAAGSVVNDVRPSEYAVGLRARIHPGKDPSAILGLSLAYTLVTFASVGPADTELPNVTYRSVRPAVDARFPLGRFSILSSVAYHVIFDAGAISTRFYGPSGYGLDFELGAAVMVAPRIELRLSGWYSRYTFSFTPPPGATFGAGG